MASDTDERVTVYEMSENVRHWEVAWGGAGLARLYVETFEDSSGQAQSTCRLHFDGDVRAEVMKAVFEMIKKDVLAKLPRGVCIVYRGHMFSNFDYGGDKP